MTVGAATLSLLMGCTAPPRAPAPAPDLVPERFARAAGADERPEALQDFWKSFRDPLLDELVRVAMAANRDVHVAQARLREARAVLLGAEAARWPEVGLAAGGERGVTPLGQRPGTSRQERTTTTFDAGLVLNWELDFFGRASRAADAAALRVSALEAGVGAAQVAVLGELSRNYLLLRSLQERRQVAAGALRNQQDALRLTRVRLETGRGTRLDVVRAESLVASTEAALPALDAQIDGAILRMGRLCGLAPDDALRRLRSPAPLPGLPVTDLAALPAGTPASLLRRRADVVQAERQLAAAGADLGVAHADLFPRVSLAGLIGFNNSRPGNLTDSNAEVFSLGVSMVWTLLDFGRLRSRVAAAEARTHEALAAYERTVQVALEETEGAMSQFNFSALQADRLLAAARSADEAAQLARVRFEAGATDFLAVLDAERQLLSARDQYVQAQAGTALAVVDVYRALGGGWR